MAPLAVPFRARPPGPAPSGLRPPRTLTGAATQSTRLAAVPDRTIAILVYDGVRLMDATAPLEVFGTAARFGADYTTVLCSPDGEPVDAWPGVRLVPAASAADAAGAHTVLVPGSPELPLSPSPEGVLESVGVLAGRAERVGSVCTGAFLLGRAGLLEGRRATTHWRHAEALARAFPEVGVEPDAIYVADGPVMTSAGVTAGIDLALAMVERDHGAALAREAARDLVVFLQRPGGQSQFSVPARTPRPRRGATGWRGRGGRRPRGRPLGGGPGGPGRDQCRAPAPAPPRPGRRHARGARGVGPGGGGPGAAGGGRGRGLRGPPLRPGQRRV